MSVLKAVLKCFKCQDILIQMRIGLIPYHYGRTNQLSLPYHRVKSTTHRTTEYHKVPLPRASLPHGTWYAYYAAEMISNSGVSSTRLAETAGAADGCANALAEVLPESSTTVLADSSTVVELLEAPLALGCCVASEVNSGVTGGTTRRHPSWGALGDTEYASSRASFSLGTPARAGGEGVVDDATLVELGSTAYTADIMEDAAAHALG